MEEELECINCRTFFKTMDNHFQCPCCFWINNYSQENKEKFKTRDSNIPYRNIFNKTKTINYYTPFSLRDIYYLNKEERNKIKAIFFKKRQSKILTKEEIKYYNFIFNSKINLKDALILDNLKISKRGNFYTLLIPKTYINHKTISIEKDYCLFLQINNTNTMIPHIRINNYPKLTCFTLYESNLDLNKSYKIMLVEKELK